MPLQRCERHLHLLAQDCVAPRAMVILAGPSLRRVNMLHQRIKKIIGIAASALVISNSIAPAVFGQDDGKAHALRGYSDASAKVQLDWETRMRAIPKPELLRMHMKHLSAEPHHVGSD